MYIPKINPDEFGPGYLIRLGLVNGLKKQKEVTEKILNHFPEITKHQNVIPYLLSVVLGKSVEDYCQQHTLLPIHRSITNIKEDIAHGSLEYEYGVFRLGHFGLIKNFKVCKSCIMEDLDYLGYSYYRRSHQIPGPQCCTKHGNSELGILYSASLKNFSNPDQIDDVHLSRLERYDHIHINRIQLILDGLCHFRQPTNPNNLIVAMQTKAKELGLRWSNQGQSELFSDYYISQLPEKWLEEVGISTLSKTIGRRYGTIDGVLSFQKKCFQAMLYITSLALLFDDSDQILSLIKNARASEAGQTRRLKIIDNDYWMSDEFLDLYLNKGGNTNELAPHLGVCVNVVSRGLKIAKLPSLGGLNSSAFKALKFFLEGMSLNEASSKAGYPLDKLEQLLRRAYGKLTKFIKSSEEHNGHLDLNPSVVI